jgi:hypothetical protein
MNVNMDVIFFSVLEESTEVDHDASDSHIEMMSQEDDNDVEHFEVSVC